MGFGAWGLWWDTGAWTWQAGSAWVNVKSNDFVMPRAYGRLSRSTRKAKFPRESRATAAPDQDINAAAFLGDDKASYSRGMSMMLPGTWLEVQGKGLVPRV